MSGSFRHILGNEFDEESIASLAYTKGLAGNYSAVPGESSYRLMHPTAPDLSLVFQLEYVDNVVDGWTYALYEFDGYVWQLTGNGGDGIAETERPGVLLDRIEYTVTEWATPQQGDIE